MIRWVFAIFIGLTVFSSLLPWLQKLGVGRVMGDMRITLFGITFILPFGSTLLISAAAFLGARFLR